MENPISTQRGKGTILALVQLLFAPPFFQIFCRHWPLSKSDEQGYLNYYIYIGGLEIVGKYRIYSALPVLAILSKAWASLSLIRPSFTALPHLFGIHSEKSKGIFIITLNICILFHKVFFHLVLTSLFGWYFSIGDHSFQWCPTIWSGIKPGLN